MNIAGIWLDFSHSREYSLYSTSHHWLFWYFLKCFFARASSSIKPPEHFICKIYFWSKGVFYDPLLSFCSTTSADLENVLPGLFVCLYSPLSFSSILECRFEVVFVQIEQFSTSLSPLLCDPFSPISNLLAWSCPCWHFKMWVVK